MLIKGPGGTEIVNAPGGIEQVIAGKNFVRSAMEDFQQFYFPGGQTM